MAFERMEPFGCAAEDYRAGRALSAHLGEPWFYYFPGHDEADREESKRLLDLIKAERDALKVQQMIANLKQISAHNATIKEDD